MSTNPTVIVSGVVASVKSAVSANSQWWSVSYVLQGTGAAQIGTWITQAASASDAKSIALMSLSNKAQVGAVSGPYASKAAAQAGGIAISGSSKAAGNPNGTQPGTSTTNPNNSNTTGGVQAQPSNLATNPSDTNCVWTAPTVNLVVTSVGGGCILTKTEVRALLGGALMGVAVIGFLVAGILMAVEGFESTSIGQQATKAASVLAIA